MLLGAGVRPFEPLLPSCGGLRQGLREWLAGRAWGVKLAAKS